MGMYTLVAILALAVTLSACGPSPGSRAQSPESPTAEIASALVATDTPVAPPTPRPFPPSPTPSSTPSPTTTLTPPTPTFTVAPSPTATLNLKIVSVTSPVQRGDVATLVAETRPGLQCTITVFYKSGASTASGLEPRTADDNGQISWSWKVGRKTTPGQWRIVVTAGEGEEKASETTFFTVQ